MFVSNCVKTKESHKKYTPNPINDEWAFYSEDNNTNNNNCVYKTLSTIFISFNEKKNQRKRYIIKNNNL